MKKYAIPLYIFILLLMVKIISSCQNNKSSVNRELIRKELISYKDNLPFTIPGTRLTITDIAIENDIVVYTCSVYKEDWESMSMSSVVANSDKNMARVVSNISSETINKFIEYDLGLKYIYTSEETGEELLEIEMTAEKLKDIRDRIKKGELEAYTIKEIIQMELEKLEIPSQIGEGIWVSDAYIDGNKVYYIATIENEIDETDLSNSDLKEMKEGVIEGLKEEGLLMIHKKELIKENIHFVYVYNDSRGKEFARIDISPYDL